MSERENKINNPSPTSSESVVTTVECGLLEETTIFVAFCSVGYALDLGKERQAWAVQLARRPWSRVTSRQSSSLLKRTTPVAHRAGRPQQCGSLVLYPYYRFLRIQ